MATNKIILRTTEQFMSDYKPRYSPLYPLLMTRSQAYSETVGQVNFRRVEAVGDVRAHHITPKDTEIRQISVSSGSKNFKKYFLANQYIQSDLQEQDDIETVVAQVLDEHQKQMDELVLFGDGTAPGNVINNGLFYSQDGNYVLKSSTEIASGSATQPAMHELIMSTVAASRDLAGDKAIIVYGATALSKLDSLYNGQTASVVSVLRDALDGEATVVRMPTAVTPANANGILVVTLDELKLNYTTLPALKNQGVNAEKMYSWHNFMLGSAMVEVLAPGAIVRQPVTFA